MITLVRIVAILAILYFVFFSEARAECNKANVCDDDGKNCRVVDVCDSYLDLPDVGVAPLKSLPPVRPKPLPSATLPPLGTIECEYRQVDGKWQELCR